MKDSGNFETREALNKMYSIGIQTELQIERGII
jgi:hypothetical protein